MYSSPHHPEGGGVGPSGKGSRGPEIAVGKSLAACRPGACWQAAMASARASCERAGAEYFPVASKLRSAPRTGLCEMSV